MPPVDIVSRRYRQVFERMDLALIHDYPAEWVERVKRSPVTQADIAAHPIGHSRVCRAAQVCPWWVAGFDPNPELVEIGYRRDSGVAGYISGAGIGFLFRYHEATGRPPFCRPISGPRKYHGADGGEKREADTAVLVRLWPLLGESGAEWLLSNWGYGSVDPDEAEFQANPYQSARKKGGFWVLEQSPKGRALREAATVLNFWWKQPPEAEAQGVAELRLCLCARGGRAGFSILGGTSK